MLTRAFVISFLMANALQGAAIKGSEAIDVGGIKQWIIFEGEDSEAPVLLFLHGGPGNSAISYSNKFTYELKKNFIVVLWDQRETGQTLSLNKSPQPLTVSLFVTDAIEVIEHLLFKFDEKKIYLAGHSWGGYLGLRVAVARPDLLSVYFAISPMINQLESERLSLETMKAKATQQNNMSELNELAQVKIPFESSEQLFYHRKWLSKMMKSTTPTRAKVDQWSATWLSLFNEGSTTNFFEFAPELKCPVYFLIGSNDYQTHFKLAESYYEKVVCKRKELYWFTHSAHNPHVTESVKFQNCILDIKNQNVKSQL
jgi:pimeloyl-ACP methyl ester carboxylesterase